MARAPGSSPGPTSALLIDLLREDGRTVIGPTVLDGAVAYAEIQSADDLPAGIGDEQSPGHYGLVQRGDRRVFDYTVGPLSLKRWTFPPIVPLNVGRRDGRAVSFEPAAIDPPSARVPRRPRLRGRRARDPGPRVPGRPVHRRGLPRAAPAAPSSIAVNCTTAASTCFCTSMGTGPEVRGGYDLVLTELDEGFLVRAGSPEGADLVARLPVRGADAGQMFRPPRPWARSRRPWATRSPTAGLHDRLLAAVRQPALGGDRRALPVVRELHDGLPDLLLHAA